MPYSVFVNPGVWSGEPALVEAGVRAALEGARDPDAEVSVTLVDDDTIRGLNSSYLGRETVTDVLSFSLGEDGRVLGDVYVCLDQAVRQADEAGVRVDEELVRLAVHGTLHVLGHDHPEDDGRSTSPMFVRQEEIVRAVVGAGR